MKQTIIIIVCALSLVIGLFALHQLYQHSKTDGFGSGRIVVNSCEERDRDGKLYMCRGDYRSNAGMYFTRDVSVGVSGGEYKMGEVVADVYPAHGSNADAREFITGAERSSVLYNVSWLALLFMSMAILVGAGLYAVAANRRSR